ncbi:MAG: hypothetical protein JWP57_4444 [Spirosoma sp.]|nr:hypothetical protein [Spirosoma sp.]
MGKQRWRLISILFVSISAVCASLTAICSSVPVLTSYLKPDTCKTLTCSNSGFDCYAQIHADTVNDAMSQGLTTLVTCIL